MAAYKQKIDPQNENKYEKQKLLDFFLSFQGVPGGPHFSFIFEFGKITSSIAETLPVLPFCLILILFFISYSINCIFILFNSEILILSFKGTSLLLLAFISEINNTVVSKFDFKPL